MPSEKGLQPPFLNVGTSSVLLEKLLERTLCDKARMGFLRAECLTVVGQSCYQAAATMEESYQVPVIRSRPDSPGKTMNSLLLSAVSELVT